MSLIKDTFSLNHCSIFSGSLVPESITMVAQNKRFKDAKKIVMIQLPKAEMQDLFNSINKFGNPDEKIKISKAIADDIVSMLDQIGTERAKFIQSILRD